MTLENETQIHATEYRETVQLDSFGDIDREGFDSFLVKYKRAIKTEFPQADINITVSETVGCGLGHNCVVWSDGEEEDLSVYSDRMFQNALKMN